MPRFVYLLENEFCVGRFWLLLSYYLVCPTWLIWHFSYIESELGSQSKCFSEVATWWNQEETVRFLCSGFPYPEEMSPTRITEL